jgi:hypothetical protein
MTKEIPSVRGLQESFQKMDKAAKEKTRGITSEMVSRAENMIKSQSTLLPRLSSHKRRGEDKLPPTSYIA